MGAPVAPPLWIWVLSGSGWIVALLMAGIMWMSRRRSPSTSRASAVYQSDPGSLRQALVEVRRCAEQNDPAAMRRAVLAWAYLHHNRHFATFTELAGASSEDLAKRLIALDRCLYGEGDISAAKQGLVEALREEPAQRNRADRADALALYPT